MEKWEAMWLRGVLRKGGPQYVCDKYCGLLLNDIPTTTVEPQNMFYAAFCAVESTNQGFEVRGSFKVVEYRKDKEMCYGIEDFRPE